MNELPSISLIVPTLNEEAYIGGLLESVARQNYRGRYEVIVADGGSTDRTCEIVTWMKAKYSWVHLVENPKRIQAAGFNRGWRSSQAEVIGYVGAHSVLAPDYLDRTVEALRTSGAAGVGGRMSVVTDNPQSETIAIAMRSPFGVGTAAYRYHSSPTYTDTILFGSYKRNVLEEVGGIDESLAANEDYELNYRLRAAGYRLYYSPDIQVTYYSRSTLTRLWKQYVTYGFWKARVLQLHPNSLQVRHLLAPLFVAGLVLGLLVLLLGPLWRWLYLGVIALYMALNLWVSMILAARHSWRHLFSLPAIFLCLHIGWGAGFWWGVWRWWIRREDRRQGGE